MIALAKVFRQASNMQAAIQPEWVPVADYLAAEAKSEVRHEYLGGLVYAMAGETRVHNTIALNLATSIRQRLKSPCKLYISDVRVNFQLRGDEYYYYPDIVVTCEVRDSDPRVIRFPKLIIEVLSESTERVDRREKFFAYTSIESLEEYVLVGQELPEATLFRRAADWRPEKISGAGASITLAALGIDLPLSEVFHAL